MGRLLRKKTVKKKKSEPDTSSAAGTGEIPAPEQQKTALSRKKTAVPAVVPPLSRAGKILQFLREVRAEYRKVTWPSRKQTLGSTIVVIVVVMIISAFLGMTDLGLSSLVRLILG